MANAVKINNYTRPVDLLEIAQRDKASRAQKSGSVSFKEMFSLELASGREVVFSKHASQRLHSRGIELTAEQLSRISEAVDKASAKGSRETLILTDDAALVVSVANRTVITAFDREHLREGVVTSIDSAVII
ncbi:MAG: TIGR02530 family flagellar biosynthesis protein [Candidatus Zixiibacteriota bacterium]